MKNLWLRLSKREKVIFSVAFMLFFLLLARYVVVNPYLAHRVSVKEQLEVRARQLQNYSRYLNREGELQEKIQVLRRRLKELESSLLEGDTSPVIASALQETVRGIASKEGVQIVATRVLNPEPVGNFLKVPIQVEVDGAMEQVASLIKGIDSSPQLLVVREITLRSLRPRARRNRRRRRAATQPTGKIRASMVIAGYSRLSKASSDQQVNLGP